MVPGMLAKTPIMRSGTKPFSKLQWTVRGAQAKLRANLRCQSASHTRCSAEVTSAPSLLREISMPRRASSLPTKTAQKRVLQRMALDGARPRTPFAER